MAEIVDSLTFLDFYGYEISIHSYLELPEEEGVYAISSDDRLVNIIDATRIRVGSGYGCGGTSAAAQWVIEEIRGLPKGTYELVKSLPEAIRTEKEYRIKSKKSWKRWLNNISGIGYYLIDLESNDTSDIDEALRVGIKEFLANF